MSTLKQPREIKRLLDNRGHSEARLHGSIRNQTNNGISLLNDYICSPLSLPPE